MAETILVVDDDLQAIKLISLMLQRKGYRVTPATSGTQALAKAETEQPDLIILDVMMPDMDGLEVCRRLRANPKTSGIPILMFTAKTAVADKIAGFQAGADDYLTKPVHPAELISRVEALLQRAARLKAEATAGIHAATIGFLGVKGGVGTSTVALNTAVVLAQGAGHLPPTVRTPPPDFRYPRVVLADLAPHGGLAYLLRLSQALGLPNVLAYPPQELDPPTIEKYLTRHVSGLRMLLTPYTPRPVMLSAAHIRTLARHLAVLGDYALFEMGHTLDDGARTLLGELRYLVLVMEPTSLALAHARELIHVLSQLGWATQQLGLVVVNRAVSGIALTRRQIEEALSIEPIGFISPAPELAHQAADHGVPIVMLQPEGLLAEQFRELARRLVALTR
ncbi:response regulator [Thermoflexus sp.]|uniref:response regulator n=1 Tax=Thermoflexus sp. TaxID=1969742 RepID=UPI0025DD6055|nr:response regulator [Thermoflexus sp.]MCS6963091.1 response regulator [Thermoflexus sp.]MCX7690104.1 response regulator [Thermoflexus sp.]MDW8185755.1 response regulator [Anaerolineae bacterium]